jgi:hypothetical protein
MKSRTVITVATLIFIASMLVIAPVIFYRDIQDLIFLNKKKIQIGRNSYAH